jgi:hypothetical protein
VDWPEVRSSQYYYSQIFYLRILPYHWITCGFISGNGILVEFEGLYLEGKEKSVTLSVTLVTHQSHASASPVPRVVALKVLALTYLLHHSCLGNGSNKLWIASSYTAVLIRLL